MCIRDRSDTVLEPTAVTIDYEQAIGFGVNTSERLPIASIVILVLLIDDAAQRTRRRTKHCQCTIQCGQKYRRWMPEIFTDQQRHAAELRVERAHPIAARKIALFVEHAVSRQIDLAMHVAHGAILKIDRRVEKFMIGTLFDQPGNEGNVAT